MHQLIYDAATTHDSTLYLSDWSRDPEFLQLCVSIMKDCGWFLCKEIVLAEPKDDEEDCVPVVV